jgi:starch synthase
MVASEAVPLAKTGGLGDVVGSLATELHRLGHDLKLALPVYRDYGDAVKAVGETRKIRVPSPPGAAEVSVESGVLKESKVSLLGIRHDPFFARPGLYGDEGGDYPDNLARFALFCRATLEACLDLNWMPDVLHAHDWQAALAVVYLKTLYQSDQRWSSCRTLFTIHNMGYQGVFPSSVFPSTGLPWAEYSPDRLEFYGQVNLLKGGVVYADRLNTVSPTYAREIQTAEFGYGLEGALQARKERLFGVINGIDDHEWSPTADPHLAAHYSAKDLAGKSVCKAALQREVKLPARNVPLLGVISRLVMQKGIDLLLEILPELLTLDVQVILLGSGDPAYQARCLELEEHFPRKFAARIGFDEALAHRIEAGAEIFLMPSRYEPCGLNQLYSLSYGTVPVVRKTGGLADTVTAYRPYGKKDTGTGFVFESAHPEVFFSTVLSALHAYRDEAEWRRLMRRGMQQDFSWRRSAKQYVELYEGLRAMNVKPVSGAADYFPRARYHGAGPR